MFNNFWRRAKVCDRPTVHQHGPVGVDHRLHLPGPRDGRHGRLLRRAQHRRKPGRADLGNFRAFYLECHRRYNLFLIQNTNVIVNWCADADGCINHLAILNMFLSNAPGWWQITYKVSHILREIMKTLLRVCKPYADSEARIKVTHCQSIGDFLIKIIKIY